MSEKLIQRVFDRILKDTKQERDQVTVLTAKTLGISPLEVVVAVKRACEAA